MMAGLAYILCIIGTLSIVVGILTELAGHNTRGIGEAEPLWEAWDLKPHTSVWREGTAAPRPCSRNGCLGFQTRTDGQEGPHSRLAGACDTGEIEHVGSQRKPG